LYYNRGVSRIILSFSGTLMIMSAVTNIWLLSGKKQKKHDS